MCLLLIHTVSADTHPPRREIERERKPEWRETESRERERRGEQGRRGTERKSGEREGCEGLRVERKREREREGETSNHLPVTLKRRKVKIIESNKRTVFSLLSYEVLTSVWPLHKHKQVGLSKCDIGVPTRSRVRP